MGVESGSGNRESSLIGVTYDTVSEFELDGKKVESPNQTIILCYPDEASQSNPNAVMDYADRIGATYEDPKKGKLYIVEVYGESAIAHALTQHEVMDLFG